MQLYSKCICLCKCQVFLKTASHSPRIVKETKRPHLPSNPLAYILIVVFILDFKDQVYKYLLKFSENLRTCIVETKQLGPQSKKIENLLKEHDKGNFRESKVTKQNIFQSNQATYVEEKLWIFVLAFDRSSRRGNLCFCHYAQNGSK